MTEVDPEQQHSLEEGLVDKGFSVDLASERILKNEEELNRPTGRGPKHRAEGFLGLRGGLPWLKYQMFTGNGRSEEVSRDRVVKCYSIM